MATRNILILIFLTTLVTVINGFKARGQRHLMPEDCSALPMIKDEHECCPPPKERIWGDLRKSFRMCRKRTKQEAPQEMGGFGPEMVTPENSDSLTPMENQNDSPTTPRTTTPDFPRPGPHDHRGPPHWKRPLSERLKDIFSTVYKEIKNTFNALWQSVVIITDHHFRHPNESCFIECIFEDQGFLMDKMVNKGALLERLAMTLRGNEPWHKVAVDAVETCYQKEMAKPSNGTCNSKSEEIFRCVFKQIFFNCPEWKQDDYCTSLKEFYQQCPDGPPPEINDNHSTTAAPEEVELNPATESVTEGVTVTVQP